MSHRWSVRGPGITGTVLATLCITAGSWAGNALAEPSRAEADAMVAAYAGSDATDAFLNEPAVRQELQKLLGPELGHLESNLNVKGSVDLISGALAISGNAPHMGTEEEAIVCVVPPGTRVEAAIFSRGTVTVYARAAEYEYLLLCTKDWITQVNSQHADRFTRPKNVQLRQ